MHLMFSKQYKIKLKLIHTWCECLSTLTMLVGWQEGHLLQSKLHGELELDADGYADLFNTEVKRVLDIHAPLRTGRRLCGQHNSRHLSDEARQAKQQRRRLERRYRQTGLVRQAGLSLSLFNST